MLPDPTMIEAVAYALRSQPPAIVRSIAEIDVGRVDQFKRQVEYDLVVAEKELDAWVRGGEQVRATFWEHFSRTPSQDAATVIAALDQFIEVVGEHLRREAEQNLQFARRFEEYGRQAGRISPRVRSVVRDIGAKSLRLLEREHRERHDFCDFLRALRAELNPAARGGPTFDTPEELEAYLSRDAA